jgi:hypothetical protein
LSTIYLNFGLPEAPPEFPGLSEVISPPERLYLLGWMFQPSSTPCKLWDPQQYRKSPDITVLPLPDIEESKLPHELWYEGGFSQSRRPKKALPKQGGPWVGPKIESTVDLSNLIPSNLNQEALAGLELANPATGGFLPSHTTDMKIPRGYCELGQNHTPSNHGVVVLADVLVDFCTYHHPFPTLQYILDTLHFTYPQFYLCFIIL